MLACRQLGYLSDEQLILDPTFGRGLWWKKWRPDQLVTHDKFKLDGVDFRHLPHLAEEFDAVAYDPPYVAKGGRLTSGLPEMDDRYGMDIAPRTPAELQKMINDGLKECARVTSNVLLVKCQSYISSGQLWPGVYLTTKAGYDAGLTLVDQFEHLCKNPRPQPPGRRQVHARRNLSTLLVFSK